jgi:predicted DNA binding CopG/RHH family protein
MLTPEQLISELQKENQRLLEELEQAQQDIKDFERLAQVWKKGYSDTERDLRIKLKNAEQTIEQLEEELSEWIVKNGRN